MALVLRGGDRGGSGPQPEERVLRDLKGGFPAAPLSALLRPSRIPKRGDSAIPLRLLYLVVDKYLRIPLERGAANDDLGCRGDLRQTGQAERADGPAGKGP